MYQTVIGLNESHGRYTVLVIFWCYDGQKFWEKHGFLALLHQSNMDMIFLGTIMSNYRGENWGQGIWDLQIERSLHSDASKRITCATSRVGSW